MNNPSLIMIMVTGALINNVVLNQFLGHLLLPRRQ